MGHWYISKGKREFDTCFVLLALIVLSPFLALLYILIYLNLGKPVLFCQPRLGLDGKPFLLRKFRTMNNFRDQMGELLPDSARLTSFGKFLRNSSLDELPELFNILYGDMSLIGPRPLLTRYLDRYTPEQARRHEVRPGLSGWAQINGRNAISWEEKFELDVWYVDNCSLWLDFKIITLTLWKVLTREGINQQGQATMEEFLGSQEKISGKITN
jgi:sugar transferase EpsL